MILIDRVDDYEPGRFLVARMAVSGALDAMAGHFPERAILPGTHLLQACSQTCIVLALVSTSPLGDEEMTVVNSIESRFFNPAVPGDVIRIDTNLDRVVSDTFFCSGRASVDDRRIAAFRLTVTRLPISRITPPPAW